MKICWKKKFKFKKKLQSYITTIFDEELMDQNGYLSNLWNIQQILKFSSLKLLKSTNWAIKNFEFLKENLTLLRQKILEKKKF